MKILTSDSSHDAYFRVLEEMKKAMKSGGRIVVIAPDRFTASVERGLLLTLGETSSFLVEVMSFTRMADKYLGSEIKKCLTPEGSVMLIGRVIDGCLERGELCYYGRSAAREGFASELYAALTAIRNSGISSQQLREAAERTTSNALKRKLTDIATIYAGYLAELAGKHSDSTTRLEQLALYIKNNPQKFADMHFFCTDINEFSAPEYAILEGLATFAASLTIGIESGMDSLNERVYPDRVIKKLCALTPDRVEVRSYRDEGMSDALRAISSRLFSYRPPEEPVQNDGFVRLRCAKDRSDEALRLALDILSSVQSGGRFKDFEVYASDIADYESELKSVFERYGIRYFIDKRSPLTEQTKARYLMDAVACARSGLGRREVLDFVKNPLFESLQEGGQESVFKFENYVLEHGIDKYAFNYDFDAKSQKTLFNKQKAQNKTQNEQISCPESVRRTLLETLAPLLETAGADGKNKRDICEFVAAAEKLLAGCARASEEHAAKLAGLSKYYLKFAEQVDKKLNDALEEIKRVLCYSTDISGFEGVLKGMLKTVKISLVPTYLDCVFVGDKDSRFMGDGKIYVLGATNDKFPLAASGGAVINMRDEELLSALDVPIVPNSRQKTYAEMFKVLDLIKKPRRGIVISYPESSGAGMLRRSTVVDELMGMLCENGEPLSVERIDFSRLERLDERDAVNLLLTERGAGHIVISSFGKSVADKVLGTAYCVMSEEDKRKINPHSLPPERVSPPAGCITGMTSVSRLETFFACPYRHFMKYILSLSKRKEGDLQGTENGTILHGVLQHFFEDIRDDASRAEKDRKIKSQEDIRAAAERYFDLAIEENGFEELLSSPSTGRLLLRVKEESVRVCSQLFEIYKRSDFKPWLLEEKIENFAHIELPAGEDKIVLKGKIDRADVYDGKFIVIDYKSFKSAELSTDDVYFGKKLQLYAYMYAIMRRFDSLKPAGVFYLPIYAKFDKDGTNRFVYKGHASLDLDTLSHIDSRAGEADSIVQLSVSRGALNRQKHLSEEEFETLGEYAIRLAGAGAHEIARGYIKPSPLEKCDEYCDFYDICAFRGEAKARKCAAPPLDGFLRTYEDAAQKGGADGGKADE